MKRNYRRTINRTNSRTGELRSGRNIGSRKYKTIFDRDLAAMKTVLRMLKRGTITAFGEIGRQYN
tara:strand:- start:1955 stop:2149 length:195 start_codon:yes stop_codon:yes gene_type:complete